MQGADGQDLGVYGLGGVRTIDDFYSFAKLDPRGPTAAKKQASGSSCGDLVWVPWAPTAATNALLLAKPKDAAVATTTTTPWTASPTPPPTPPPSPPTAFAGGAPVAGLYKPKYVEKQPDGTLIERWSPPSAKARKAASASSRLDSLVSGAAAAAAATAAAAAAATHTAAAAAAEAPPAAAAQAAAAAAGPAAAAKLDTGVADFLVFAAAFVVITLVGWKVMCGPKGSRSNARRGRMNSVRNRMQD